MDKISIIVPIYNGDKYLERCINSLINQTYLNLELIFINDGSIDNSLFILEKYKKTDKRIKIIDKKNTGVSDSRNIGIKKSSGKYICFCDCDDIYESNYIEKMYNIMIKYSVDIVKCNYKVIDKNNIDIDKGNIKDISNKKLSKNEIEKEIIPKCLEGSIPCFSYLIMIDRKKLNVQFPTDIAMMEDVVFYLRLLLSIDSMYIIDDCLYTIMYNEIGATNNVKNYKRNILNIIDVNQYIRDELKKYDMLSENNLEKLNINHLNAISDFIFRYYLYSKKDTIMLCKEISCNNLLRIIDETNLRKINIQRRIILIFLNKKRYLSLKIYFFIRKILFGLRRI